MITVIAFCVSFLKRLTPFYAKWTPSQALYGISWLFLLGVVEVIWRTLWIILTNSVFTIVKEQPPSTPPRGREQACISLNLHPLGGLRGYPILLNSPPKRPPLLTIGGKELYLCIPRRQRGGNEKSRPCHPHAGVEDGTGDGQDRLSLGIRQAQPKAKVR